jgi:hypothetical protein
VEQTKSMAIQKPCICAKVPNHKEQNIAPMDATLQQVDMMTTASNFLCVCGHCDQITDVLALILQLQNSTSSVQYQSRLTFFFT